MTSNPSVDLEERLSKAAVIIRRMKERIAVLEEVEQKQSEPIAIVGIGCRFPGAANNPSEFWSLLESSRDAVQPLDSRWKLVGSTPSNEAPSWAGILTESVDTFEPEFFGISAREATWMDPQQRLLLEVAWEALENAAILPRALDGSKTGVFVGACSADYQSIVACQPREQYDLYSTTGNILSIAAGRLSYTFGLQGPCLMVDTACSSSLVTTHLACRSLRANECDLALAGGVNLILSSSAMDAGSRLQALSPDGRCRTFDAAANGFVRGEGCGLVVLKRLSDALRNGDRILAIIRGSAINQDGRSTGLTAPNVLAQQALLRTALKNARVEAESIGYIETHGTGTPLGDPIEVEALRSVIGSVRPDGARCYLGALKTNIGHLEGAAGIAGLIKAVLVLEHGCIPRNLNFRTLNPRIRLEGTSLAPAMEAIPWPRSDRPRYAGVSAFGLSGTNAHMILEEAPIAERRPSVSVRSTELIVLSARTETSLNAQANRLRMHLEAHPELGLRDVAYSLATTRTAMEHRLAVTTDSLDELREALIAAAKGETPAGVARGRVSSASPRKVVFVFPGHGSQWLGMGRELLTKEPVFRASIEACDRAIQAESGFSVIGELLADESASQLTRVDVVQPVLFAIEVALAALWQSWGVKLDGVVGHSMGEVAAAYVAGALSLEDAVVVICRRSRLLRRISGQGTMALVELSMSEAATMLSEYGDRLSIAVNNSPRFTAISGEPAALSEVLTVLEKRGVFVGRVKGDVAFHSAQVDPLMDDLLAAFSKVKPKPTTVLMWSTVTGDVVSGSELSAAYWANNVRQPVRFAQVVKSLSDDRATVYVELSPHPILVSSVEEILEAENRDGLVISSLRRQQDDSLSLRNALGALWVNGEIETLAPQFPLGGNRVPLPNYVWQDRERYWLDAKQQVIRQTVSGHPLLGDRTRSSLSEDVTYWTSELSVTNTHYLKEHQFWGDIVFPAAGYIEMALKAASHELGDGAELKDLEIAEALLLTDQETRVLQVALSHDGANEARFQIASTHSTKGREGKWTVHARGRVRNVEHDVEANDRPQLAALLQRKESESWEMWDGDAFYDRVLTRGLGYGETFRGVRRLWRNRREALAELACVGDVVKGEAVYGIHPGLLDAALQAVSAAFDEREEGMYLPVGADATYISKPSDGWVVKGKLWSYARRVQDGSEIKCDVFVFSTSGEPLIVIRGFTSKRIAGMGDVTEQVRRWLYEVKWEEMNEYRQASERDSSARNWVVFADTCGSLQSIVDGLKTQGCRVIQVLRGKNYTRDDCGSRIVIQPQQRDQYVRLLEDLGLDFRKGGWGILHAWCLDESSVDNAERTDAGDSWSSLFHLVQAIVASPTSDAPRLVVLTCGARSVLADDQLNGVLQTPVIGLCKTIVQEHPELACQSIDMGDRRELAWDQDDLSVLLKELKCNQTEEEVALRQGRRFVPRLVRVAPRLVESDGGEPAFGPLHPDGIYLIAGGFGGLGLALAQWLVGRGARRLALLGRSVPNETAQRVIDDLRGNGVEVFSLRANVAREEELRRVIDEVTLGGAKIRGLFQLAGFLDNAVVSGLSIDRFAKVLEPKLHGTWNLHRTLSEQPLDMFVLFSSIASVTGAAGQGNYAAANAFLDGFAAYRTVRGLCALSINWGAWADVGIAADAKTAAFVTSRGLVAMKPHDALRAFAYAAAQGGAQRVIADFDGVGMEEGGFGNRPLLSQLAFPRVAKTPNDAVSIGFSRKQVLDSVPNERHRLVTSYLCELVSTQTGFAKSRLDVHRPLVSLGLDSLMTLKLKNSLETSLGVSVPATFFLQGVTTIQLASRVVSELCPESISSLGNDTEPELSAAAARAQQRKTRQSRRTTSGQLSTHEKAKVHGE